MSEYKLHKLDQELSSEEYHAITGTWSSSQFKDLLDDEDVFIKKHIKKEVEREESPAFDVGSYFHTGVLEPHKLKADCVVYPGKVRRGKDWDKFKAKHRSKVIVTQAQKDQAEGLVKAVKNSPVAQEYLDGESEVSLFVKIAIHEGKIYAPYFGKVLTPDGWADGPKKEIKGSHVIIVKVRADTLGDLYISDLKSTTGNARSEKSMRDKISYYNYDLSAALYLDLFGLMNPELLKIDIVNRIPSARFAWIFASKDLYNSKTYRASEVNFKVGRAKYMRAMLKMADCAANDWQSVDSLGVLEPLQFELEYLIERDVDLL